MNARRVPRRLIHVTRLCLSVALVLSCFVFPRLANLGKDSTSAATSPVSPPPEGNGYTYSRSITIDHTKVPSDQSNFPLLISGTYSYLATVTNGGNVQDSNGYDVIFTSDSSCATKLNHEVESYNATTGAVNYWVKVPTVSHANDTTIYMCYGNASISTSQENKNGVWDSSFLNVLHFANPTTFNGADSTGDGNTGTLESPASAATGKMGGALYSNNGDVNRAHGYNHGSNNVTLSAWVKTTDKLDIIDEFGTNNDLLYLMVGDPFGLSASFAHKAVIFYGETNDSNLPSAVGTTNVDDGNWHHIVGIRDETNKQLRIYVDGALEGTTTYTGLSTSNPSGINSRIGLGLGYGLGYVDEFRESHTSRSADWIKTEYNNQSSPSTFYTISSTGAYTYRRSITIDHTKVPNSDQSNFPLLISGTYSYLATVANGGRVQNSNGYDIIFTSDSSCATKLNHEVETYNAGSGAVNYWVKVPTVSHASDTTIYMCYGNSSISTDQSSKTGVWDANFKGVYHIPDGSSLTANDSSSNANGGTANGATAVTGEIGGGASCASASSQYLSGADASSLAFGSGNFTVSFWIKTSQTSRGSVVNKDIYNSGNGNGWYVDLLASGVVRCDIDNVPNSNAYTRDSSAAVNDGSWHHVVMVRTGANAVSVYVDGALSNGSINSYGSVGSVSNTQPFQMGKPSNGYGPLGVGYFNGSVDEVRLSNLARSADWIATEYSNQSSPLSFYAISAASGNQPPVANAGGSYTGITGTAVSFSGSSSSDPDGTIASYSWNFGDSNSGSGATPTHTYATAGTYTVTLTVTDNLGATNSASTTATISNRSPVANAGGPYTGITGTAVSFSGSSSSDPDGTIASYAWTFGDGNSVSGATPTHTYATAGTYTVTLTVTDNLGATNSASTTATISNRPPVANAGGPYSGTTGTAVSFSGSNSSDPDGTIASYAWNYGDGNSGTGVTPTHTYVTAGAYTVTLTVTDNLGATAGASASAVVTGTLDARLDPLNHTGGGGEDPLSRNFNWSIPLVGLPGRSGLDLGLSLTYNSLATWTRNGNAISFDDDHGSPAPGFRIGFPVIQGNFYNSQAGKYSFIMITPSGNRLELRQVGASTLYQSVDSSYVLLDASTMKLRTTDGTQLSYAWMGSDYECTEIKDRNGNFITINYDGLGRVDTVIDTLSRTVHFNYDSSGLSSITQTWAGQTHYWARFTYASQAIQTNFTNLTVYGPSNNSTIHALTQVKLADDSHFDFDYTSWGQVWKISQYTGETSAHLLNYRSYNLPADNSTAQTDCPRFTVRHDWAENWNRDTSGNAQEVNTSYAAPVDAALPDNSLATVTRTQVSSADGTYQQIYFAGNISGGAGSAPAWKRGLPLLTDTFDSNNTRQRSAATAWTQDDTSIAYQLNPRVTETNTTDPAGNHARSSVDYVATTLSDGTTVNLPQNTYEYQADASTQLRRTHVEYNLSSTYTSSRIIGLVSEQSLYGGPSNGETLMSKVSYQYDESGSIQGIDAPVQHDNTNYSASLVAGRGNLSSVKRYDANNTSQFTASTMQYNTAGAVVVTLDPLNHGVTVSYADSFSDDNNSRNTLAYPTTVTDAGGFSSSMKYNYDFGGATRRQTPLPNVTDNEPGPVQTIEYDSLGRLQKVKNLFNNAYTRYEYPASQNRVDTYATIQDNAGEAHSFKITDGHGRVIASAADHPGSTGGFSGQLIYYDTMGRVIKQSNPIETSASSSNPYSWTATGDDAASNGGTGWVFTQQTYDWKGRPLVTTNTDNTIKSASYGGCGCAGGQVVTLTDEVNRQQKIYSDVLGRQLKTEILNTDLTVYSATANTFNARDQVTLVRQYQGPDTSTVYHDTTMSYDGYGRLLTKHVPEQQVDSNNSSSTDHTTWDYNNDDTIHVVTDARGASATYSFNNRRLVTGVTYSAPSGITATGAVSYSYDAVGNRTSMTDGLGSQSYSYNQLSQLTSESRTITNVGTFTLAYSYTLAGQLAQVSDQTSSTSFSYAYDSNGRMTAITGAGVGSITSLATNLQYRASSGLKQMTYGNGTSMSLGYNGRGLLTQYALGGVKEANGAARAEGSDFQYYADGQVKFATDYYERSFYSKSNQDRAYQYDQVGRLQKGMSSADANDFVNGTQTGFHGGPFQQTYAHDAWNNLVDRTGTYWGEDDTTGTQAYETHNRNTAWTYDAAGNLLTMNEPAPDELTFVAAQHSYDAIGRHIQVTQTTSKPSPTNANVIFTTATTTNAAYDGDGQQLKRVQTKQTNSNQPQVDTTYYLCSSVLGQVITDYDGQGARKNSYVYASGNLVYEQLSGQSLWHVNNPLTGDARDSDSTGKLINETHLDPEGVDTGASDPANNNGDPQPNPLPQAEAYAAFLPRSLGGSGRCRLEGFDTGCGFISSLVATGLVGRGSDRTIAPIYSRSLGRYVGFAQWDSGAAAAGVGVGTGGLNGLSNNGQNTGWVWLGQTFSTQNGVGGVSVDGTWHTLGDYGYSSNFAVDPQDPGTIVDRSIDEAARLLTKEPCWSFVHDVLGVNNPDGLTDLIRKAKLITHPDNYKAKGEESVHAEATWPNYKIDYYKPFFTEQVEKRSSSATTVFGPVPMEPGPRKPMPQGQDTLHEGIHLWTGKEDFELANMLLTPGQKPFTKKDNLKASGFWHDKLKDKCNGKGKDVQ